VINVDAASLWTKQVAADKSYSFHYPSGWKVSSNASVVEAVNSKTEEQLIMAMIPFDQRKSPQELADEFIEMQKDGNPNILASNWRSISKSADNQVVFDLSDRISSKEYAGLGIVIKSDQQAIWFSYFAPEPDYYQVRAYNILEGFISSLASGSASKAPSNDYNIDIAGEIDRNAKAFMFVLEFTLGAPFTQSQEKAILNELKDGWRYRSEEELKKYDQYPALVKAIMTLNQKELEEVRSDLEKTVNNWLDDADQSDQAVMIINRNLKSRGRVVIKGEPPLTEMSLTAYSEIISYARLLQKNAKAKPEQISQKSVNSIKKQVKKAWNSFSAKDKNDIATTPGLWVCLRAQLKYGSKEEQDKIRENLKSLAVVTRDISSNNTMKDNTGSNNEDETKKPMDPTAHWCMMQMQQQTFNMHMWSMGFNYLPATGKLW
jgi:hypothetical protein